MEPKYQITDMDLIKGPQQNLNIKIYDTQNYTHTVKLTRGI